MNLYPLALALGFLFFFVQFYLSDLGAEEPGIMWLISLALSIIFFSLAIFRKYKQEKRDRLNPPSPLIEGARIATKKLVIMSLALFACGYLVAWWSEGWGYIITIPMWIVSLSTSIVALSRMIKQLK